MKSSLLFSVIISIVLILSCKQEEESNSFALLTSHIWTSDSLLVDRVDASGPGKLLEKFKGDAYFKTDGSGYFGKYIGTWMFSYNKNQMVITSDSLLLPMTVNIVELTLSSLKLTTTYPNINNLSDPLDIRMTFKPK